MGDPPRQAPRGNFVGTDPGFRGPLILPSKVKRGKIVAYALPRQNRIIMTFTSNLFGV